MSTHSHDSHGHGAHGGDHVPHVLDLKWYLGVFAALLVFTVLTVAVSYVDLGRANLFIAMLVASCKALMVAAIFMHLAFDKKFNAIIFGLSVLFLFIFIVFTMFDTSNRGLAERVAGDKPANISSPFDGTKGEQALQRRWAPAAPKAEEKPAAEH
jgi:cytochrome c oxidase subunit 4